MTDDKVASARSRNLTYSNIFDAITDDADMAHELKRRSDLAIRSRDALLTSNKPRMQQIDSFSGSIAKVWACKGSAGNSFLDVSGETPESAYARWKELANRVVDQSKYLDQFGKQAIPPIGNTLTFYHPDVVIAG